MMKIKSNVILYILLLSCVILNQKLVCKAINYMEESSCNEITFVNYKDFFCETKVPKTLISKIECDFIQSRINLHDINLLVHFMEKVKLGEVDVKDKFLEVVFDIGKVISLDDEKDKFFEILEFIMMSEDKIFYNFENIILYFKDSHDKQNFIQNFIVLFSYLPKDRKQDSLKILFYLFNKLKTNNKEDFLDLVIGLKTMCTSLDTHMDDEYKAFISEFLSFILTAFNQIDNEYSSVLLSILQQILNDLDKYDIRSFILHNDDLNNEHLGYLSFLLIKIHIIEIQNINDFNDRFIIDIIKSISSTSLEDPFFLIYLSEIINSIPRENFFIVFRSLKEIINLVTCNYEPCQSIDGLREHVKICLKILSYKDINRSIFISKLVDFEKTVIKSSLNYNLLDALSEINNKVTCGDFKGIDDFFVCCNHL